MCARSEHTVRALALVESVQGEPAAVRAAADEIIRDVPGTEAAAIATWARGLARRELGDLGQARRDIEAAIRAAADVAGAEIVARMRDSLAFTLFLLGEDRAALRQTDLAAPHLKGAAAARLRMQQGLILHRLGDTEAALRAYRRALTGMVRAGDTLGEVRLRVNRSILHTYRWDLAAAQADLERAHALALELGQPMVLAGCQHNLGYVEGRRGDVPAALEWYARARETYRQAGISRGNAAVLEVDQAQLLLEVGLSDEAFETARRAIDLLGEGGNEADRAEATLLAAQAALASRRIGEAEDLARTAADAFARQHRTSWRALADYVALQARLADLTQRPEVTRRDADRLVAEARTSRLRLQRHGWRIEALHAATIEARGLLAAGRTAAAKRRLDAAQRARHRGPVDLRLRAWHATALLRAIEGNRYGAFRALTAGLQVLDTQRSTFGAAELRASSAQLADDLVELGVGLALEEGRPDRLLRWADRSRAGAIRLHPATPPTDPHLAAELTELRRLEQQATEATLAGRDPTPLHRARAELEARIRSRTRRHRAEAPSRPLLDVDALRRALQGRTLVEYVEHRGTLHAVVVDEATVRHHDLGPIGRLTEEVERVRFDLVRLARRASPEATAAAAASLTDVGSTLERRLLAPLTLDTDELVIVPSGRLHGLVWRALPGLAERAFTVVPSAQAWMRAVRRRRRRDDEILVVAGPGLDHARREVEAVARVYDRSTRLTGRNARVGAVLERLEGVSRAHIVCHGRFRPDNPMFSSLLLADGSLTVYDMERLRRVPENLTLPACDAGVSGVRPGNELLGFTAALLALGVRTVTVPQVPIPDDETAALMAAYHRHLRRSSTPPRALAAAISEVAATTPSGPLRTAMAAFVVMGA